MKHILGIALIGLTMVAQGCGGPGHTLSMSVTTAAVPAPPKTPQPLRIAVIPFEDQRTNQAAIGRWQHYFESTVDRIVPAEGSAAEQVTGFVAEYLKKAGFQVTRAPAGKTVSPDTADVALTGQIEEYWTEAVSRFGRTEIQAKNRLVIKVSNLADNTGMVSTVGAEGTSKIFKFDISDLESLSSETLGETLARFLADVKIRDHSFAVKSKRES